MRILGIDPGILAFIEISDGAAPQLVDAIDVGTGAKERVDAIALAGSDGALVSELMMLLDRLELNSAAALLDFVQHSDWNSISYDVRVVALHQINNTVIRMRERHGLAPFDDSVPNSRESRRSIVAHPFTGARERRLSPSEVATAERTGRNDKAASE